MDEELKEKIDKIISKEEELIEAIKEKPNIRRNDIAFVVIALVLFEIGIKVFPKEFYSLKISLYTISAGILILILVLITTSFDLGEKLFQRKKDKSNSD